MGGERSDVTGREIAIETRGEGGYAIVAPSLHPSGARYESVGGNFAAVPTIPQEQADAFIAAARSLDECPITKQERIARERAAKEVKWPRHGKSGSVIDAFNSVHEIAAILEHYGYTMGPGGRHRRPDGRTESVTISDGRSFHHSTNDLLHDGRWHRPFDVFCKYDHGGDCPSAVKAAARELGLGIPSGDSIAPIVSDDPREDATPLQNLWPDPLGL
jgi:hypothetical protein